MTFQPKINDSKDIILPEDIQKLAEELAEHAHEVWAAGRINDGWIYGEKRDDKKKTHPCLVPYADLPESEKEYDRNTSLETLKLILSKGYEIHKKSY